MIATAGGMKRRKGSGPADMAGPPVSASRIHSDGDSGARSSGLSSALMIAAAALVLAAIFLPLWGMTLASIQYPDGLRMVIYPTSIRGDITELNLLNHYIGMAEISDDFFAELRVIPVLFVAIAIAALGGAMVRRLWASVIPLMLMLGTAVYGLSSMRALPPQL